MYCKKCGALIDDDSKFCKLCGNSIIGLDPHIKSIFNIELYESLRVEYAQTWEDLRHRTTIEMTILSVFFATTGALFSLFFIFYKDYWWIGILVGPIGVLFVSCILFILFGERRAWSADVARLKELEFLLSNAQDDAALKKEKITLEINRHTLFECHWTKDKDYKLNIMGSFMWYVIIVSSFSLFFGGLFGLSIIHLEWNAKYVVILFFSGLFGVIIKKLVDFIRFNTVKNSKEACAKSRGKNKM